MKRCRARITEISKDDMQICSSRVIRAKFEDNCGNKYQVAWADTPTVIGITGTWDSRNRDAFERAWRSCNVGDEVWLYHAEDSSYNYFEPI